MQVYPKQPRKKIFYRVLSLFTAFIFTINYVIPPAYAQNILNLPVPGTMVAPSAGYIPTLLKGIKVDPVNPLYFDFIVDTGDSHVEGELLKEEANKLVRYFLATLTTPEDKLWVNLSPYEQNRMIPDQFGQTEMGRDLLAQDYILKQLTASLMYPEEELGNEFWKRVYKRAQEEFGVKEIPMNTFNKVWIVPSKAVVYQKGTMAYVVDSHLKVMMEEDYTALKHVTQDDGRKMLDGLSDNRTSDVSHLTSNVIREVIIPEIEKEVNEGETFSNLRQIYHSVILATWFKENLKQSLLGQIYVNKGKTKGVDNDDPTVNEKIYQQYLEAFKVGVYDYIREEYDPIQKDFVARKYFSGGTNMGDFKVEVVDNAQIADERNGNEFLVGVNLGAQQAESGLVTLDLYGKEEAASDAAMLQGEKFDGDQLMPVYYIGEYASDINDKLPRGNVNMKRELGGKGTGLFVMSDIKDEDYQAFLKDLLEPGKEEYLKASGIDPELLRKHADELGINVPLGYTIATEQTKIWSENNRKISVERGKEYFLALKRLEEAGGLKLGDAENEPLLVAVRSGAAQSMPGMMDTILNLGMNDQSVESLAETSGDARFAWDAYRRFIEMFGRTVLDIDENEEEGTGFSPILEKKVHEKGVKDETELDVDDYRELVGLYKEEIARQKLKTTFLNPDTWEYVTVEGVPQNPYHQYFAAVETVMRSTFNDRAFSYRKQAGLALEETVSAVNVVKMIYGNKNDKSGTGVAFSRNVQDGENKFLLEFAFRAQGEDVVAGRKEGMPLEKMRELSPVEALNIQTIGMYLEQFYQDAQDMEFTFEHNVVTGKTTLFMLQTRNAKRSLQAAIRIAVEMVEEGLITEEQAVERVEAREMEQLLASRANPDEIKEFIGEGKLLSKDGLNAAPGLGVGHIVFSAARAEEVHKRIMDIRNRQGRREKISDEDAEFAKYDVILMRDETSPEDLDGMLASDAIYTARGGRTSHAAVVARQFGIPAVVGDSNLRIDFRTRTATFNAGEDNEVVLNELDIISVDGTGEKGGGRILLGALEKLPSIVSTAQNIEGVVKVREVAAKVEAMIENLDGQLDARSIALKEQYQQHLTELRKHIGENEKEDVLTQDDWNFYFQYKKFMEWVDNVRINAGLGVGANAERPLDIHSAILNGAQRVGLARTEHMFSGGGRELMFQKMIFAANEAERREALKDLLNVQQVDFEMMYLFLEGRPITIRLLDPPLHEFLPHEADKIADLAKALGISTAAVRAKIEELSEDNPMFGTRGVRLSILFPEIIEMQTTAILQAKQKVNDLGVEANPEIMVPLVGNLAEYKYVKSRIVKVSEELGVERRDYKIGTMQEIIAFAPNAGEIGKEAQFFSAGTNDYTQGIYKFSREDGGEYLAAALLTGVFPADPFVSITPEVAEMLYRVYKRAYENNPDAEFKCGMCGEQGVDIESIQMALAALNKVGLDYVSGGARRLPGARLMAAQEVLKGVKPYEGKDIKLLEFERNDPLVISSIADAETLTEQFKEARDFIVNQKNNRMAIETAIGNLDLSKPVTLAVDEDPNAQYVIRLAKTFDSMAVKSTMDVNQPELEVEGETDIGLVTLEHYFSEQSDIELIDIRSSIQEYLLTTDQDKRKAMLDGIKELIRHHLFSHLGRALNGQEQLSVRLPNIALEHAFKYASDEARERALAALARRLDVDVDEVKKRVARYKENNPAIGQRGARVFFLSVAPLYTAIAQAVVESVADSKNVKHLDIILPFIVNATEIRNIREGFVDGEGKELMGSLDKAIAQSLTAKKSNLGVYVGSNIETPSAAIGVQAITEVSDGEIIIHNRRLTEAVWAAFEGDARAGFLDTYLEKGIWEKDPYVSTPPEALSFIEEVLADLRTTTSPVNMIANPADKEAIILAQAAGVNALIVEASQIGLAQIAAVQAALIVGQSDQAQLSTGKLSITDIADEDLNGKTVAIRVDFNVPIKDGVVVDDARIKAALETINYVRERGAKVVLLSHLGDPQKALKEADSSQERSVLRKFSLKPVVVRLRELIPDSDVAKVYFEESYVTMADARHFIEEALKPGEVFLLENTRLINHEQSKVDADRDAFGRILFDGVDLFVNDAFSVAHRAHASVVGIPEGVRKVAGLSFQREQQAVRDILEKAEVIVMGGSKVSTKIGAIGNLVVKNTVKNILIGGAMANAFFKAKGIDIGASTVGAGAEDVEIAEALLKWGDKIVVPTDVVVASAFDKEAEHKVVNLETEQVPQGWIIVDIGPETIKNYKRIISENKHHFWNGNMGASDVLPFAQDGTRQIAREIAKGKGYVGGGDSGAAIRQFQINEKKFGYVSTSGGAFLDALGGSLLPGESALSDKAMLDSAALRAQQLTGLERIAEMAGWRFWTEEVRGVLYRVLENVSGFDEFQVNELINMTSIVQGWENTAWIDADGNEYPVRFAHARVVHRFGLKGGRGGTRYVTPQDLYNTNFKEEFERFLKGKPTRKLVEQYILSWIRNMASDLAFDMTFKNYANNIGYGGAKAVVFMGNIVESTDENGDAVYHLEDYEAEWKKMNPANVAQVARKHARALAISEKVGVGIDHPAADMKTDSNILSIYADEYFRYLVEQGEDGELYKENRELYTILRSQLTRNRQNYEDDPTIMPLLRSAVNYWKKGNPVKWLGVFSSKLAELGGIAGRTEATGIGIADVAEAHFATDRQETLEGKRVNLQGFGNVGSNAALELTRRGALVTAIGDAEVLVRKDDGFSLDELQSIARELTERKLELSQISFDDILGAHSGAIVTKGLDPRTIANRLFHDPKVDILVPAAVGGVITENNESGIREGVIIIPGANGAVTVEANTYLNRRNIIVISPTLASAKGVITSSIETEANLTGIPISKEEARERAKAILMRTYQQAYELKQNSSLPISMDTALNILAISNFFGVDNTTDRVINMLEAEILEKSKEFLFSDLLKVVDEIESRIEHEDDLERLRMYSQFLDSTLRPTLAAYVSRELPGANESDLVRVRKKIQAIVAAVTLKTNQLKSADVAQLSDDTKGGIDLNPQLMGLEIIRDESGMPLPVNQQPILQMEFDGFSPVIINVTPIGNLPLLLGLQPTDTEEDRRYSGFDGSDPMDRKARFENEKIGDLSYLN